MNIISVLNFRYKLQDFCYKAATFVTFGGNETIVVDILPRSGALPVCSICHKPAQKSGYISTHARMFRFVSIWDIPVEFRYRMRRCYCSHCNKRVVEEVPWAHGKMQTCKPLDVLIAKTAKEASWQKTKEAFDVSWKTVSRSVSTIVEEGLKKRNLDNVTAIGVDEVAWKTGHEYITLVYQIDKSKRRLLWIGQDRTKATLEAFFDEMESESPGFASRLEVICSDMWQAYRTVCAIRAPQAKNVLDKYHIMTFFSKAMDDIRRAEVKRLGNSDRGKVLVHSRFVLLKRREHLTEKGQFKLKELMRLNTKPYKAYLLIEQFCLFWDCMSVEEARKFFLRWYRTVRRTRQTELKKIAENLRNNLELLLNYFRTGKQYSSGIVEGQNRIVNLVIRKAFGFRSFKITQVALFHSLGGLKMPEVYSKFA